ncbi:MAG: Hpt domain-containing protein, partial [Clostridiaceae bacterium]
MDTSQYLSMFLEESIDNLQTLNESLLQLEQEPDDIDKLNEIFRVAHTIKGMAATMGFNDMAELTHKMEDVLSQFREGNLRVTQEVVTVLFKCLDTLEQMVNNISEGTDESISIDEIMENLESIAQGKDNNNEEKNIEPAKEEIENITDEEEVKESFVEMNEYDINVIKQAIDKGFHPYQIKVILDENTLLKSARAFLIFKGLEEYGEITKCIPSADDLENENFDLDISIIYLTHKSKEEIYEVLINISEVSEVIVDNVNINENVKNVIDNEPKEEVKQQLKEDPKQEVKTKQPTIKP